MINYNRLQQVAQGKWDSFAAAKSTIFFYAFMLECPHGRADAHALHDLPQQRMRARRKLPEADVRHAISRGGSVSPRTQPEALPEGKRRVRPLPPGKKNPPRMGDKGASGLASLRQGARHKAGHARPLRPEPLLPIFPRGTSANPRRAVRNPRHLPPERS